ncbi:SirB2 family protein [Shewanella yunxiaonensis]|uniref:SirB2 family protein n=1 Tax=Shewanella yunxiaonensis TaxID=2829809 RepID=A0ABX7YQN2_9GAMM|nr:MULTISPECIES: SirB2 family protein [Shewanella]MDF0533837.1 SirB2 family protein [Shewanella sp. A32]QUN05027.1 SirB2 family protein [Shewanella yunxiaonensis]
MDNFYSFYSGIKYFHLLMIGLSVMFLSVRFVLNLGQSAWMDKRLLKVAPHVIDTLLLLSGVVLCFMIKQYPFVDAWMTEKLGAVVAYIILAMAAMKSSRGKMFRIFAFLGALGWLVFAAKVAYIKQAVFLG